MSAARPEITDRLDPSPAPRPSVPSMLAVGRTLVMGILNVTPDSFSDGGKFIDPDTAIAHARRMIADGADFIDIGAESTRPYGGMKPVTADDEMHRLERILPAVVALGVPVSIDTMKAAVADWAVTNGAAVVNDVWGLQRDPDMAKVVAARGVPLVAMSNRETADAPDIMANIAASFTRTLDIADKAGIRRDHIILDPGIGFGMTAEQSLTVIARLAELKKFNQPILLGASRKRFIDKVTPAPPDRRLGGSLAVAVLGAQAGAAILRVHDVAETVQALTIMAAVNKAQ
jgi:dihydropteroate synthase